MSLTDADAEAQMARLRKVRDLWYPRIQPPHWRVDWVFCRERLDESDPSGRRVVGRCVADWRYLEAEISFDLEAVAEHSDEELEIVVVHEMCHILVNETRATFKSWPQAAGDHEERVVTQLSRILLDLRDAVWDEANGPANPSGDVPS